MSTRLKRVDLHSIKPIGARITFERREWLPSMLRRVGHALDSSAADIANWCGLDTVATNDRQRLGNTLTPEITSALQAGLGITPDVLATMVMSHIPEDLAALRFNGTFSHSKNWTRGGGTRYCPDCLREKPGVFRIEWRLWWCFICEQHNTVLHESCPACHQPIVEATSRELECQDPSRCWATLDDDEYCQHPLARTWTEDPISSGSPMVLAQHTISRAWNAEFADAPDISAATLRGVSIALLAAGHEETIAELSGVAPQDLSGLFDHSVRIGTTPPREPLAMAALLGAAYRIVMDDEQSIAPIIRELTYDRSARNDHEAPTPWSARNFLEAWPGIDAVMRGRIIRALDLDLSPIQRLVHGSAASSSSFESFEAIRRAGWSEPDRYPEALTALFNSPDSPTNVTWADAAVPSLLWSSWAAPLGVNEGTDACALQMALSDALRIAGTAALPDFKAIAGIGRRLRKSMLGNPEQTTSILRQICELALVLRAQPGPINYRSRRRLATGGLLSEDHWHMIAASVSQDPGRSRKLLNARRYCYMRMTATSPAQLPQKIAFQHDAPDAAEYTQFITLMTAELQTSLDAYLAAWLTVVDEGDKTVHPPVTWSPARFAHVGAVLGPELDDIDIPALHEHLRAGITAFGTLGHALNRSPRHVRWAIAAHPLSSGKATSPIDWSHEDLQPPRTHVIKPDEALKDRH